MSSVLEKLVRSAREFSRREDNPRPLTRGSYSWIYHYVGADHVYAFTKSYDKATLAEARHRAPPMSRRYLPDLQYVSTYGPWHVWQMPRYLPLDRVDSREPAVAQHKRLRSCMALPDDQNSVRIDGKGLDLEPGSFVSRCLVKSPQWREGTPWSEDMVDALRAVREVALKNMRAPYWDLPFRNAARTLDARQNYVLLDPVMDQHDDSLALVPRELEATTQKDLVPGLRQPLTYMQLRGHLTTQRGRWTKWHPRNFPKTWRQP